MKFSVITATHLKNSFLDELYESLISQTYENWEWVLLLNGGATREDISEKIKLNPKVAIFTYEGDNKNVGFVKNLAFNYGVGDVLVELDHDDILTPDCLSELEVAFKDPKIGFVYSDNAVLDHKEDFSPYGYQYGWTHTKFPWQSRSLYSMNSFPATSHSLSYIWFAPDHVRAWRKDIYNEIGGHNKDLSVCDDHELMIRTYLETEMFHIKKILYIYRITGDNTWLERNALIQTKTVELHREYSLRLAERDCQKRGLLSVDVSDIPDFENQVYFNLSLYETGSIGVLKCKHKIQKFLKPEYTMKEMHRSLADGGWAFIEVPSTDGRGAWQDPTHRSFWNENSFWYYTKDSHRKIIDFKEKFQQFDCINHTWENNIIVTNAVLVAEKGHPNRPKLSI
jgi:O-antigen biosynthesis protein